MKETGSKPLKRDDLDSDVSLTHTLGSSEHFMTSCDSYPQEP